MKYFLTLTLLLLTCTAANSNDNPIRTFVATSFCHGSPQCRIKSKGITASGTRVKEGIVAADIRILKFGTKIKVVEPLKYAGIYVVRDTGKNIVGNRLDFWLPSQKQAIQFGRRLVKVQIIKELAE